MSDSETKCDVNTDVLLWHPEPFLYNSDSSNYREMNVTVNIPESARNNGTVFAHIFLAGVFTLVVFIDIHRKVLIWILVVRPMTAIVFVTPSTVCTLDLCNLLDRIESLSTESDS